MPTNFGLGMVLRDKTLGIWGYGRIGQIVAGYGKAFGMHVMIWGSEDSRARAVADGYLAAPSREVFFEASDVLSLHLKLVDETRGLITLEDAVHRMTDLPASVFGLTGRSVLAPGNHADIVIFDPDTVCDKADFEHPTEPAAGIDAVYVNGQAVVKAGAATGARPGKALRRQAMAKERSPARS